MVSAVDAGDRGGPGGVLRLAVRLAQQVALEDGPADGVAIEEVAVVQPFRHQRVDEASIRAVSVPGMLLIHSAPASSGRSLRSGPTRTNSQPRARARSMAPRSTCLLTLPPATMLFFSAMPPKASTISVCSAICSQVTLRMVRSS